LTARLIACTAGAHCQAGLAAETDGQASDHWPLACAATCYAWAPLAASSERP